MVKIATYQQRSTTPSADYNPTIPQDQSWREAGDAVVEGFDKFQHDQRIQNERARAEQARVAAAQKAEQEQNDAAYAATQLPKVAIGIGEDVNALRTSMPDDGSGHAEAVQKAVEARYEPLIQQANGNAHLTNMILADRQHTIEREVGQAQERQFGALQVYRKAPFQNLNDAFTALQTASPDTLAATAETLTAQKLALLDKSGIEPIERETMRQSIVKGISGEAGRLRAKYEGENLPLGSVGANADGGFSATADFAIDKLENNPTPIKDINGYWVKYGVNSKWHPGAENFTRDQAKAVLKKDYWDAIGADKLPIPLATVAFDAAMVNGPEKAKEWLAQSKGNIPAFQELRRQEGERLAAANPGKYGPVLQGWNNRIRKVTDFATAQAAAARVDAPEPTKPQLPPATGQKAAGNLDPWNRPILHNPDGSYSTTSSMSIGTDAGEVLIPTVVNGVRLSKNDAIEHFRKTGENFGTFDTPEHADAYATELHNRQAAYVESHGLLERKTDFIDANMTTEDRRAADKIRQDAIDKRRDDAKGALEIAIDQGRAGLKDVEAARAAGIITPNSAADVTLTKQADEAEKKAQAARAEALTMDAARKGATVLDPQNEKHRKALDTDFAIQAQGWKPEEYQARTAAYVRQFGIVPASVRGVIEGGLRSADPQKVLAAANFYDAVRAAAPAASKDFSDGEIGRAELLLDYERKGLSPTDAMSTLQVADKLGKDEIARRDTAFGVELKQAKYDPATYLKSLAGSDRTLNEQARGWFGLTADGKAFRVPAQMDGEVRDIAMRLYRSNGSVDASLRAAWQITRHAWQPSMLMEAGPRSFSKNSPELLFGKHTMNIEQNARWIREQAANEIAAAHAAPNLPPPKVGLDPTLNAIVGAKVAFDATMHATKGLVQGKGEDLMLHEAPNLQRNGLPVYYVSRKVDGFPHPVVLPDGSPLLYQPHFDSSPKAGRLSDRQQERERNARNRRGLIEKTADYPMASGAY